MNCISVISCFMYGCIDENRGLSVTLVLTRCHYSDPNHSTSCGILWPDVRSF